MKFLKSLAVGVAVLALAVTLAFPAKGGKKGKPDRSQEAAAEMMVEWHGHPGCDMIVTTNHFTLAPGESSNPIVVELFSCESLEGPVEWLSIFGYLTTNNSSRTFDLNSGMVMTGINEDTGTLANSNGGRVMIGEVDFVVINAVRIFEPVPDLASFFVTNMNNQEVTVRLSSVVHFE